ncbi:MAG: PilZ domain-containing protein, partial [Deltaproteobacteria bacterium]|nr:PilZ domain-containing protein [Deltaproteobacteria bacterium]
MKERRRYRRFHLAGSVKIRRSKGSVDALTLNLSLGGIGVYAKNKLKTGE